MSARMTSSHFLPTFVIVFLFSFSVHAQCNLYNVTGGGTGSSGSNGVSIMLSGSQIGHTYQLKHRGMNIGEPVEGTGSALHWKNITSPGVYNVVASKSTSPSCTQAMTGSVNIALAAKKD